MLQGSGRSGPPEGVDQPSFLDELKRRKVPRVALVYGATAFAVVEIADIVMPRLGLPDWTVTLVIVLAVLGLPIALVLAWAFDLTPEGVKRADEVATAQGLGGAGAPAAWASPRALFAAAALVLVGVSVGWFTGRTTAPAGSGGTPPASVAVLPFANLSEDAANEYFSDGLSEEILNVLAKIDGLKVAARTSAFAYKDRNVDIREIGEALGVGTVLEGSVRKADDRVRVTAQLIQTSDGFHLWSENYDRELEDVFAIQDDIARRIAQALRIQLGMEVERRPMTSNVEAYERFLEARHLFHQRTEEALYRSIELYEEALEIDPDFAEAHVGLGLTYLVLPGYADPDFDAEERAREAVERGLATDSTLALGYAALGNIAADRWDLVAAHSAFGRARAIDPNDPTILLWHAIVKLLAGHVDMAEADLRRAIDLDPASGVVTGWLGHLAVLRGDTDAALELYRRSIELTWGAGEFHLCILALAQDRLGEVEEPCAASQVPALRDAYGRTAPEQRRELLRESGAVALLVAPPWGEEDAFFRALGETLPRIEGSLVHVSIWRPEAAPYRSDPRFSAWVEAAGLPAYWDVVGWPEACTRSEGEIRCG
jgi:TolB-like protein